MILQTIQVQQATLDTQCKICYLDFDEQQCYPMMVCSSQHLICSHCFSRMSKQKKMINCPFCKRAVQTSDVYKFKYALTAKKAYDYLRVQYYKLLDKCNQLISGKTGYQIQKFITNQDSDYLIYHKQSLASLQNIIQNLKQRLKKSQIINYELNQNQNIVKQKYTNFEKQINNCKLNQIIIKNKMTMKEYQVQEIQRQKGKLNTEIQRLHLQISNFKAQISYLSNKIQTMKKQNLTLTEKLGQQESKWSQVVIKSQEQCPQIIKLQSPNNYSNKKNKTAARLKQKIKTEGSQEIVEMYKPKSNKNCFVKIKDDLLKCYQKKNLAQNSAKK